MLRECMQIIYKNNFFISCTYYSCEPLCLRTTDRAMGIKELIVHLKSFGWLYIFLRIIPCSYPSGQDCNSCLVSQLVRDSCSTTRILSFLGCLNLKQYTLIEKVIKIKVRRQKKSLHRLMLFILKKCLSKVKVFYALDQEKGVLVLKECQKKNLNRRRISILLVVMLVDLNLGSREF